MKETYVKICEGAFKGKIAVSQRNGEALVIDGKSYNAMLFEIETPTRWEVMQFLLKGSTIFEVIKTNNILFQRFESKDLKKALNFNLTNGTWNITDNFGKEIINSNDYPDGN
jgi:hypothetical protein